MEDADDIVVVCRLGPTALVICSLENWPLGSCRKFVWFWRQKNSG